MTQTKPPGASPKYSTREVFIVQAELPFEQLIEDGSPKFDTSGNPVPVPGTGGAPLELHIHVRQKAQSRESVSVGVDENNYELEVRTVWPRKLPEAFRVGHGFQLEWRGKQGFAKLLPSFPTKNPTALNVVGHLYNFHWQAAGS